MHANLDWTLIMEIENKFGMFTNTKHLPNTNLTHK